VDCTGIVISRMEGGKIAEDWANFDDLGMMQQLGAISK
jgi:predicted ester cyclase